MSACSRCPSCYPAASPWPSCPSPPRHRTPTTPAVLTLSVGCCRCAPVTPSRDSSTPATSSLTTVSTRCLVSSVALFRYVCSSSVKCVRDLYFGRIFYISLLFFSSFLFSFLRTFIVVFFSLSSHSCSFVVHEVVLRTVPPFLLLIFFFFLHIFVFFFLLSRLL